MTTRRSPLRTGLFGTPRKAWLLLVVATLVTPSAISGETISFVEAVAPILAERCVGCHTPGIQKGGLSLATPDGAIDEGYLIAGDAEGSYLVDVISSIDGEPPSMPHEGEPLTNEQVETIRRWINEGAEWPEGHVVREKPKAGADWWSLQPIADPAPPTPEGLPEAWSANPIDRFVFDRLKSEGLQPSGPADPRTLRRRVTYGLTGLPPEPMSEGTFDYEALVEDLLASRAYGEHWGRHWLDVVRFGESNGYERNNLINSLWPFRDYVIRSFNEDKRYDKLVREHLAGDLDRADRQAQIGSAFLVAGTYDNVGNKDPAAAAQIRANTLDEIIRTTSEAFLGMTVGCARCHDHKFDPILQADYYRLNATFAGVRHGEQAVATDDEHQERLQKTKPLEDEKKWLAKEREAIFAAATARSEGRLAEFEAEWTREPVKRSGVTETFDPVETRFVRLVSEGSDMNPDSRTGFRLDEFEVWTPATPGREPRNVALASQGGIATGKHQKVPGVEGAFGPQLAIDGVYHECYVARGGDLTIELAEPTTVDRVVFSSARDEPNSAGWQFSFLAEYRIEVSDDGEAWTEVANSHDRKPVHKKHRDVRLREAGRTRDDNRRLGEIDRRTRELASRLEKIPEFPKVWIGRREEAPGPFHVMVGGDPMKRGEAVTIGGIATLADRVGYELADDAPESERREQLAEWIVDPANPLTARVLANRLWHYHFGKGIVDTPSDFGYMGGRPTHPELLDWLAKRILESGWRLKPIHRLILSSQTYQQASVARTEAMERDADSRLLWRFPPRRLTAEELRDTMLSIAGRLGADEGGPGFRLYHYQEDNVSTYFPNDEPGEDTYRRAVYHQNARSAPVDLLAEFDQPDCAFTTPRRSSTTTPLQALTLLNHRFTLDMAEAFADRLADMANDPAERVGRAYAVAYARPPSEEECQRCVAFAEEHGWPALCRVLLNTTELITIR